MCQLTWKLIPQETLASLSANTNSSSAFPKVLCFHSCFFNFSYFQTGEPCLIPEAEISVSQCILAHLPSPSHNPPHQPWLSPGKLRVYKPGGNSLSSLPQFSNHFCSGALSYSSNISICSWKPLWPLSGALLLPGLFTSNTNFLTYFPYPYTPKAPGWGEATLLWY